jgi:hypothetical protein
MASFVASLRDCRPIAANERPLQSSGIEKT